MPTDAGRRLPVVSSWWHAFGRQLRRPEGFAGRLLGRLMGLANARPNRIALQALNIRPQDHVLELGFGPGHAIRALSSLAWCGQVHGVDHSPAMLAQATRRNRRAVRAGHVRLRLASFKDTGLPDASMDKVLAVNVAYFFGEDNAEVQEAWRVLKPGGRFVIYVTDAASMSNWPFASTGSHRLFDADALQAMLIGGGFAPDAMQVRVLPLPLGVKGLLAIAMKGKELHAHEAIGV